MHSVRYGGKKGKKLTLGECNDLIVVRSRSRSPLTRSVRSKDAHALLAACDTIVRFPDAGVEVIRLPDGHHTKRHAERAKEILGKEKPLRFAGRVLRDRKSGRPLIYTENFFVKFEETFSPRKAKALLKSYGLTVKRELGYASHACFVEAAEGTGQQVFSIGEQLLAEPGVEFCHPELVRQIERRAAFPQQWHLKETTIGGKRVNAHAHVESAWELSTGEGITIAVIDDGVDVDHEEFAGSTKVVAPRDVTRRRNDGRPVSSIDDHGTACAGVACASGKFGASGVAPDARLMPIRFASGLGSQAEADAFEWAADRGADVISCSWGPADGEWWNPNDPVHDEVTPLPDSSRLAIDYALTTGRGGKGCVITWAAGNGNESADLDGYAANPAVIAVAACGDRSRKSVYSDFGDSIWCCFPSSDFGPPDPLTPGIWTTDRSGGIGYSDGDYANDFGGTSSSCPGAAGVAALVLARNSELRADQVRQILRGGCDPIDSAGGDYDADGHSPIYGYGRLNARRAVELAVPSDGSVRYTALHTGRQAIPIEDLATAKIHVEVGDDRAIRDARIHVDLEHTWVGDLVLDLVPPTALGVGRLTLSSRSGGNAQNLKKIFDSVNAPALLDLAGKKAKGRWTLEVKDEANRDTGRILGMTVELEF